MILRGDTNATLKDLTLLVEDVLAQTRPNLVPLLCHVAPEDGAYTRVPVSPNLPFPKKFEGERSVRAQLPVVNVTYNQDTYELTVDIDSDHIKDARAYDYSSLVREAAVSAVLFPDYLLSAAVVAGATATAYDGVTFYGTTHKYAKAGANTIDNTVASTGITVPTLFTDLGSAIAKIRGFKDNGDPGRLLNPVSAIGEGNFIIQCPLALEQNFRAVLNADIIPSAPTKNVAGTENVANAVQTNTLRSAAMLFPDGYLTGNTWYLHYVGMPQKPFVYFERYGIQQTVLGLGSEFETNQNLVRIALKHRFVQGYHRFDRSIKVA